jgi:hypothetical protein
MTEFEGTYWIVVRGDYAIARTLRRSRYAAIEVVTEEQGKPWGELSEEGWHVVEVEVARHAARALTTRPRAQNFERDRFKNAST